MSCLLARRARALKYSRRLGRGRPALRARAIPQSPISAPCGCGGRAKCAECARVGETEASRPTGRKLGGLLRFSEPQSGPGWHGGGSQTGRPDGRGQISLASMVLSQNKIWNFYIHFWGCDITYLTCDMFQAFFVRTRFHCQRVPNALS